MISNSVLVSYLPNFMYSSATHISDLNNFFRQFEWYILAASFI